jgi:hypothetical protein
MSMKILAAFVTTASMASLLSCSTGLECGSGTVEKEGECVADGDGVVPGGNCGAGSVYDPTTQTCIGTCQDGGNCGICGPGSELKFIDGIPTCVGTGDVVNCDTPILCPQPDGDRFMACGRVYDTGTTTEVRKVMRIGFFDALGFATNPDVAPEFTVLTDECGRFKSTDGGSHNGTAIPSTAPFIVVSVDDNGATDEFVLTGIGLETIAGDVTEGVRAFATSKATATAWGHNLVTQGAMLAIFIDKTKPAVAPFPGTPAAGVTLTIGDVPDANKDFYFSDTAPLTHGTVDDGLDVTGANGAALYFMGDLVNYSGTPDLSAACKWPKNIPGATLANTVFVAERCCAADEASAKCY